MGIRLEIVLIVLVALTVIIATTVTLKNSNAQSHPVSKELEFKDTTFIEVDKEQKLAKAFSQYGIRLEGTLTLLGLKYQTDNIEKLVADKAKYESNILYLDGNVQMKEKDGFSYITEHANYDQKTEILTITSPFVAKMDKNIIRGDSLVYDAVNKEAKSTHVKAEVYTVEK